MVIEVGEVARCVDCGFEYIVPNIAVKTDEALHNVTEKPFAKVPILIIVYSYLYRGLMVIGVGLLFFGNFRWRYLPPWVTGFQKVKYLFIYFIIFWVASGLSWGERCMSGVCGFRT